MIEELVTPEQPEEAAPMETQPAAAEPVPVESAVPEVDSRGEAEILEDILAALVVPEESAAPEVSETPVPVESDALETVVVEEPAIDAALLILDLLGETLSEQPWEVVEAERPFMTTPFTTYTVTEGLLLLVLLFFFLATLAKLVKGVF